MKYMMMMILALFFAISTTACTTETQYGECLGLDDLDRKDPKLIYDLDVGNVIGAVVFAELMLIPTIYVALTCSHCPVAVKRSVK